MTLDEAAFWVPNSTGKPCSTQTFCPGKLLASARLPQGQPKAVRAPEAAFLPLKSDLLGVSKVLPEARVGPTADVGRRFSSVGGGPERLGPVRRPQRASLQQHPRRPRTRRWPERGQSGRQVAAPCKQGHRQRSALLGGLQVAIPFQERGPDREPHLASGPSAARCEGADGGGRVAAQAPGLLLTWPFPVSRRALASRPQKFPSRVHRGPPTGAKSLVPGSRAPGYPAPVPALHTGAQ